MRVFISYASEDRREAEEIALALKVSGHKVFFDRSSLSGGEDYHSIIRDQIGDADLFVFLITQNSLREGSYTLTELRMAREKWPHPAGHVLPVLSESAEMDRIPAYLRGVTLFEPEGDLAAEVAAHLVRPSRRLKPLVLGAVALAVVAVVAFTVMRWRSGGAADSSVDQPFVSTIESTQFVSERSYRLDCNDGPPFCVENTEYALDSTHPLAEFGEEMIKLQRVASGNLALERPSEGFNITISLENVSSEPIQLDISPRFFELADNSGGQAELLYFCCEARGVLLEAGGERTIQLIYRSMPGWSVKETAPSILHFRISGLLPLTRGTWIFILPRTAG